MKSLTSKFVLSVLSLVLTGVALSVGVYAWFTINNAAEVQAFTTEVRAGSGFYVSLNGSDWTNIITTEQIEALIDADNFRFDNVTSPDGVTMKTLAGDAANTLNYIEFPLYFAGNAALDNVRLSGMTLTGTPTSWIPGINVPGTRAASPANPSAAITDYASNAVRVSFEDQLASSNPTITVVEQADGVNGNSLGKGAFATNEAVLFYNAIETTDLTSGQFDAATLPSTIAPAASMTSLVTPLYTTTAAAASPAGWEPNLPAGVLNVLGTDAEVAYIRVRVWIEGWDQEAFNAILSGTISISLDFDGYDAP